MMADKPDRIAYGRLETTGSDSLLPCHCGHGSEEHGFDPKYPASMACNVEGCYCIEYDANHDAT